MHKKAYNGHLFYGLSYRHFYDFEQYWNTILLLLLIVPAYYVWRMGSASAPSRLIVPAALAVVLLFFLALVPSHAAAQTVSAAKAQTNELLPPDQNTCQAVSITNIQPYIYDGVLESFDVTISDTSNSYVGILAQVGNTPLPLDYITRWAGTPSGLRIHVDTPDMPIPGTMPVSLMLLSSPPGAPTCMTVVTFNVREQGVTSPYPYSAPTSSGNYNYQAPSSYPAQPSQSSSQQSAIGSGSGKYFSGMPAATSSISGISSASSAPSSAIVSGTVTSASNMRLFDSICAGNNSYRLWFALLVLYIVIVGVVVFAEPWFLESSVIGSTAAILVPLILLLGFWYLSETCRAASWIPVAACVIAIAGLFLAFRDYELPPLLPAPSEQ